MKTVFLAVLLLLAVASTVSGDTKETDIVPGNRTESNTVSGEAPVSGKLRYGDETCFLVILQTLKLYRIASLLNYDLRNDVWRNTGKTPSVLVPALEAKIEVAQ
jgi:hypothetical protein